MNVNSKKIKYVQTWNLLKDVTYADIYLFLQLIQLLRTFVLLVNLVTQ